MYIYIQLGRHCVSLLKVCQIMCGFCNVWVFVCVGVCMSGFCSMWEHVRLGFAMCGCFDNCVFWQYVYLYLLCFVLFVLCFCIVSFMYIYSYLLLV